MSLRVRRRVRYQVMGEALHTPSEQRDWCACTFSWAKLRAKGLHSFSMLFGYNRSLCLGYQHQILDTFRCANTSPQILLQFFPIGPLIDPSDRMYGSPHPGPHTSVATQSFD